MKVRTLVVIWLAALAVAAGATNERASLSASRFQAIKTLAGDWAQIENGKPTGPVLTSFRVTSAGSAVRETLFPGTPHEMVTMYYLDGTHLQLTHYCSLGNQPTMRAGDSGPIDRIDFRFVRGGAGTGPTDEHMNRAVLTIADARHLTEVWSAGKDGHINHTVTLNLIRKP